MATIDETMSFDPPAPRFRSVPVRILTLALLALSLQIPIAMIDGTIYERRESRNQATASVTESWGGRQVVRGPFLAVPYLRRWTEKVLNKDGTTTLVGHQSSQIRYVLPETLVVGGRLDAEVRRRGIFDIPLYVAHLDLAGSVRLPALADFPTDTAEVHWDRTTLATSLADPRSIREEASLEWKGQDVSLEPGPGIATLLDSGVHAVVPVDAASSEGSLVQFRIRLAIAGSDGLDVLPAGSDTSVSLTSKWVDPSFEGAYLPITRSVGTDGFEASWKVLRLARGFPPSWVDGELTLDELDASLISVRLLSPVDAYTATERAVKYEMLFVVLTFGALFLIEVLGRLRVHPVQYLLIGFALCLFYLLLLSLAEHIGFTGAFAAAATAITLLVAGYSRAVLGSRSLTAAIACLIAALYLYLFVLLQIQDFALVVGAAGLFVALAIVMFLTRRVDWYRVDAVAAGTRNAVANP
jgi:inner membrane protein